MKIIILSMYISIYRLHIKYYQNSRCYQLKHINIDGLEELYICDCQRLELFTLVMCLKIANTHALLI